MTIDEAIAYEREKAKEQRSHIGTWIGTWDEEYSKRCEEWAKEHEQRAEWLEELKCYRNDNDFSDYADRLHKIAFHTGYNKAIDDFVKFASNMPTVETEDGEIRPMWLEEIAEQMKAGEENEEVEEEYNVG